MLVEHQVRYLLAEAERVVGHRLEGIRGHLRSETQSRSAIWELIVIDAATRAGQLHYERPTESGLTPDLYVETQRGSLWIEAAFLFPRFADIELRQEDFRRAVWAEERQVGLPAASIGQEFYGEKAPYGYEIRLPPRHELPSFFRSEIVSGFFATAKKHPDEAMMVDLGEFGATVRLAYLPRGVGTATAVVTGSSVVIEQPNEVTEHAVYRLLAKKAKKYRADDLGAPLLVCIGSERSTAVRWMTGVTTISTRTAISEACRKYPVISAVIVVSIEDVLPTPLELNNSRRARVQAIANHSARFPLSDTLLRDLDLRFDRVDYGHSWNEWEGVSAAADRIAQQGGRVMVGSTNGCFSVALPANEVVRVLGGGLSADEWQSDYGFSDAQNPLKRAMIEGRPVVGVELLPHDPRSREPQHMRITFGPPTPLLLQTPKKK